MGFNLNGYVLRPARVASGNAQDSNEAVTGVDRDHILPDTMTALGYQVIPVEPVEPYADMYRAAVLEKPESQQGTEQYCVFAASTGSLSTVEDVTMAIVGGSSTGDPIPDTLPVPTAIPLYNDGTTSFYIRDEGQRDISEVISITVLKVLPLPEVIVCGVINDDPTIGKVTLDATAILALEGGFSAERGDAIVATAYLLASPAFWWTKNDPAMTRFGWDGKTSRWLPLRGGAAQTLGAVMPEEEYKLVPPVSRFEINDQLPGDSADPDAFALVRCGLYADADSTPLNILVVSDANASGDWNGAWDAFNAVVGVTAGVLLLNPAFATDEAGRDLWYNAETYLPDADGDMGAMVDFPTGSNQGFPSLSPTPEATDRPFLRIGSRRYLTPIPVETDADLDAPSGVTTGSFQWSKATGKIVLSDADIARCTPGAETPTDPADYEIPYLGARLYFDGLALNTQPLPLKAPIAALNEAGQPLDGTHAVVEMSGKVWVPRAVCLPPPGISGIRWEEDGTGETPTAANIASNPPQTRPRGCGLVRRISGGGATRLYGDTFLFSKEYAYENLDVLEYDEDLKTHRFQVPRNEVEISRMTVEDASLQPSGYENASRIQFRRRPVRDEPLYFRSAEAIPSVYADEARIFSRFREDYTFIGSEIIRFAIDNVPYEWGAITLNPTGIAADYSAEDVVADMIANSTPALPAANVGVIRGRIFLQADNLSTGSVEIGWNDPNGAYPDTDQTDLSGHAALGFLPGWRVDMDDAEDRFRWLPDNGSYIGVFRSPVNMDRTASIPDVRAVDRLDDTLLSDSIPANPFLTLTPPPLLDVPGYSDVSHFQVVLGILFIDMENYQTTLDVGVVYDWVNDRLIWSAEGTTSGTQVPYPTSTLQLEHVAVFPETVDPLAMDDTTFGLNLRRATDVVGQTLPADFTGSPDDFTIDFLMPGEGQPGQAELVTPEGEEVAAGGKGTFNSGISAFYDMNVSDQTALYDAVEPGYLLHILGGDGEGIYTITFKGTSVSPATFTVSPTFAATESSAQWRIYKAQTRDDVDLTLLADVQRVVTNHFPEEPFKVRVLTSAGVVGHDGTAPLPLNAIVVDAIASNRVVRLRFGLEPQFPLVDFELVPTYLVRGVNLGLVMASGLVCPDLTDPHLTLSVTASYFQIRVGAMPFSTTDGNLTLNVGSVNVGDIDVDTSTGEILVGVDVVSELGGSPVYFDQLFLNPDDLPSKECEINGSDGEISIPTGAATAEAGKTAYLVEQMVTENKLDVVTNPMNGSVLFNKPLREWQIVEVNYFQADTNGDKALDDNGDEIEITEFLSLMVTLEVATYINDTQWSFNPTERTVSEKVEEFMWVGSNLMNFAGVSNATAIDNVITIIDEAAALLETDAETVVKINYGVLEAFGGESAYTVSTPPVFRKPFWIEAEASTFTLETDRTGDFLAGLLMVLGPTFLYIDSSIYQADTDETTVTVFPPPEREAGSRAPGRDAGLTLSDFLVSVSRGGSPGFMPTLDTAVTPLLEMDKGQVTAIFYGDVRQWMKTNHLLEIGGYPYLIVASAMSEDGYNTLVQLGTPAYKAHDNSEEVRVSVRQVYAPAPVEFRGISPFVPSEEYDLFLMGRVDSDGTDLPGKVLVEGMDYTVDPASGDVVFQHPTQAALQPGQYLHFRYTRLIAVGPTAADGAVLYPVYRGRYLYMVTPSVENRLLGAVLKAQYSYRSQDSFFYSIQMMEEYLGEVSVVSAKQGVIPYSGGPAFFTAGAEDISKKGGFGLRGGAEDAANQDRGARVFVEFFNGVILAFEQVLEAIDGRIIGDRDGKFRFFIGHDKRYSPPGYEDAITGNLNNRLLWREIIDAWAPSAFASNDGYFRTKDIIYLPPAAEVPFPDAAVPEGRPGETSGPTMDPALFTFFVDQQHRYIKNDMDDRVLVKLGKPIFDFSGTFMFPVLTFKGNFDGMWEDHRFSRLFPTETEHFSRLFPGINYDPATQYPGFFTPGRDIEVPGPEPGETSEQTVSTTFKPNGVVSNNALGEIPNIIEVNAQPRQARGRVWAYYPSGSTELDTALGIITVGYATIVATPLTLGEFPIDPDTGFPDVSDMVTSTNPTGTVYSLESGNPDMATPVFEVGQRANYGKPDGSVYSLKDSDGNGIYVESVLAGCVLILGTTDDGGSSFDKVGGNGVFVDGASTDRLDTVISDDDGYADTVFIGVGSGAAWDDGASTSDAEELAELQAAMAEAIPNYRMRFDLGLGKLQGNFKDVTLPGPDDNFFLDLQALFGQKPPDPLTCVEGSVQFINTDTEPLKLPCLLGEDKDDSGDQQIPFMKGVPNELQVLGEVAPLLEGIYEDTGYTTPYAPAYYPSDEEQVFKAVYPDETFVGDGELYEATVWAGYPKNPATLYTDRKLDEATVWNTANPTLTDNTGLGDLRRFDLLFSQVEQGAESTGFWEGATGILEVADVVYEVNGTDTPGTIEIPRFVSPAMKGAVESPMPLADRSHRYTLRGWAAYVEETEGGNEGVKIPTASTYDGPSSTWTTVIDFSTITNSSSTGVMPDLSLLDGIINLGAAAGVFNAFVIRIYDPDPNANPGEAFLGAITIVTGNGMLVRTYFYNALTGNIQAPSPGGHPVFGSDTITLNYWTGWPGSTDSLEDALGLNIGTNYDFRLDIDTYGDVETGSVSSNAVVGGNCIGSETCAVLRDRLTFTELLDFTLAKPRDYLPANGDSVELGAALNVWEITANGVSGLTVNDATEINGSAGLYLTFLNRLTIDGVTPGYSADTLNYVGTFDAGTNTGAVRLMSWEGHGNIPLAPTSGTEIEGITLSAASSSDLQATVGEAGDYIICAGTYTFYDGDSDLTRVITDIGTYVLEGNRNYLLTGTGSVGGPTNIVPNDICVIGGNPSFVDLDGGAVKCGTYLVRHAVPDGDGTYVTEETSQMILSGQEDPAVSGVGALLLAGRQWHEPGVAPFPASQATGPSADTWDGNTTDPTAGSSGADYLPAGDGFVDLTFPTISAFDEDAETITLTGVLTVMGSPSAPTSGTAGHGWGASGRLYLILKNQYASYSEDVDGSGPDPANTGWIVDADSVYSVAYSSVTDWDYATGTLVINTNVTVDPTTGPRYADDDTLDPADFWAAVALHVGGNVSGMTYFGIRQMGSHLPGNNLLGPEMRDGAHDLMAGFQSITIGNRNATMLDPALDINGLSPLAADDVWRVFSAGSNLVHDIEGFFPVGADEMVAGIPTPQDNTEFYPRKKAVVYGRMYQPDSSGGIRTDPVAGVCTYLQTDAYPDWWASWKEIHFGDDKEVYHLSGTLISAERLYRSLGCLLPSDRWVASNNIDPIGDGTKGDPGFFAYSGVFLEPSFPRPVQNINNDQRKVVAESYDTLTTDTIGARDYEPFSAATVPRTEHESVFASIRRTRRWHQIQIDIIDLVEPLRYVYEIRRGFMGSYDDASRTLVALTTVYDGYATNLGAFDDDDVNIHAGDVVRVVDENGEVLDTAEIQRVEDATTLILRRPGLTNPAIVGDEEFEVYIEQAIVPHEQSNEQLLDLLTQEVVFTRRVPYVDPAEDGGFIDVDNEMKDTAVTSWTEEGVQEDDYVIIDPAGPLYNVLEQGARPFGDSSVVSRPVDPPYIPGPPSDLDDNRGFYKITDVDRDSLGDAPGTLIVTGVSRFSDGELFGSSAEDAQYVVLPTISASDLTVDGFEDQQALRRTAGPVGPDNKYLDRPQGAAGSDGYKSISPFAYRIIRPNPIFSQDTVELILFIRERMLSWIDEINTLWNKGGNYYVFQRDDHIEDVGSATDATAGMGLLSNLVVDSLKGFTDVEPYANCSDCLSVLGRRFWCLDFRLDGIGGKVYTQFATGDFGQRPVEPDLIDGVLNTDDLFRDQRYGWITFRSNREDGSIRNATREQRTLESRLAKQRAALMRQKGLDET